MASEMDYYEIERQLKGEGRWERLAARKRLVSMGADDDISELDEIEQQKIKSLYRQLRALSDYMEAWEMTWDTEQAISRSARVSDLIARVNILTRVSKKLDTWRGRMNMEGDWEQRKRNAEWFAKEKERDTRMRKGF